MRLFVAIELDEASRASVAAEQRRALALMPASLRLVGPDQMHLTLAFLGNTSTELAASVVDAMQQPFVGVAAFRLSIGGLGVFPPRGAPHTLWLGVVEGARETMVLQAAVVRRLDACGVALEDRPFHPHVTLGRWKHGRASDRPAAERSPVRRVASTIVERVTLFESRLSSQGARHFPLAHAHLSPTA